MIYFQLQLRSREPGGMLALAEVMADSTSESEALEATDEALAKMGWRCCGILASENFTGRPDAGLMQDPLLYARAKFMGTAIRIARSVSAPAPLVCEPAA